MYQNFVNFQVIVLRIVVLKATVKYRNHLSILKTEEICKKKIKFSYSCVSKDQTLKEL